MIILLQTIPMCVELNQTVLPHLIYPADSVNLVTREPSQRNVGLRTGR